jgi:DsbC/DsbD-like thiol-disulfide interchange protein
MLFMRRLFSFLVAGLLLAGTCCLAETIQARHARVELLSQASSAAPGKQLWLGLHFSLEKDWHIYWQNPGDSGQPPVLQWQLPSGFSAGEIQWPLPEKLKRSTLADYGYQDDVVLLVPVQVAAGLKNGDQAQIGLQARWLICSDVCIPDHAQLHLSLPLASGPAQGPTQSPVLNNAKKRLPRPLPASWKAWATAEKDDFVLSIVAGKPISSAEFFPLTAEEVENAAPQPVQTNREGAKITLKKSDQILKPIRVLKGLLVLGGEESYRIEAPVTSAATAKVR